MQIANYVASRMPNGMVRSRTPASALTDCLIHGRATVVKLCDMGNRQCLHLSILILQYNGLVWRNCTF